MNMQVIPSLNLLPFIPYPQLLVTIWSLKSPSPWFSSLPRCFSLVSPSAPLLAFQSSWLLGQQIRDNPFSPSSDSRLWYFFPTHRLMLCFSGTGVGHLSVQQFVFLCHDIIFLTSTPIFTSLFMNYFRVWLMMIIIIISIYIHSL